MRPRLIAVLALSVMPVAWRPSVATAQALTGTVRGRATGLPIRGAFLELLDQAGKRVTGTLSDSTGHYVFNVVAGRYALVAEAMGYQDAAADTLDLASEADRALELRLSPSPIELPPIGARAAPRCQLRRDTAGAVLAAWLDARKALRLTDWSMKESGLTVVTRGYARSSAPREATDSVWVDTVSGQPPFKPIELASARDSGLFRPTPRVATFFAPGPDYVLSDDFLEAHCFSLRQSGDRLGLDFVPVSNDREGEIRGTLWLDLRARALERIDFRYSAVSTPVEVRGADGSMEFARTPDGYYIIRRWQIRLPRYVPGWGRVTKLRGGAVVKAWLGEPATN